MQAGGRLGGLAVLLGLAACGGQATFTPPGAGAVDAGPDAQTDASTLDAGDAGLVVADTQCGGSERLEVLVVKDDWADPAGPAVPAGGAILYLRCDEERGTMATAHPDGRFVFGGLPADQDLMLTAEVYGAATTLLGLRAGGPDPVEVAVPAWQQHLQTSGHVARLANDSLLLLSTPDGIDHATASADFLFVTEWRPRRITALEALVSDDEATLLGLGDAVLPETGVNEVDVLPIEAGPFETASVELLFDGTPFGEAPAGALGYPLGLPAQWVGVRDAAPERSGNLVGITTRTTRTADGGNAEVAWWPSFEGGARTVVTISSVDAAVLATVRLAGSPDALGPVEVPAPPAITSHAPDASIAALREPFRVEWPAWADRRSLWVGALAAGGGFANPLAWRIEVLDDREEIDLATLPMTTGGSLVDVAELLAPAGTTPRIAVVASSGRRPFARLAIDARARLVR